MDIQQYIASSAKQYRLRIKTVVPLDDAAMDRIERALAKFLPLDFSVPQKTILQRHPLDFKDVANAEVWIIDAVFGLPISPTVAREDVRKALDAPEAFVVVRDQNEAIEIETLRLNAVADIEAEASKRGLTPAPLLSNEVDYIEAAEVDATSLYGDAYNHALKVYLARVEDERPDMRVRTTSTLFDYLDMPGRKDQQPVQDDTNFNDGVAGSKATPMSVSQVARGTAGTAGIARAPVVKPKPAKTDVTLPVTLSHGTLADRPTKISRVFTDKAGKRVVLSRELGEAGLTAPVSMTNKPTASIRTTP